MSGSTSPKQPKARQAVTLSALEARIATLQARANKIKEQDRAQDTRAKIVLGGAVMADPDARRLLAEWLPKVMDATRPSDRASWDRVALAFGKKQLVTPEAEAAPPGETNPIRQRLTAVLGGQTKER